MSLLVDIQTERLDAAYVEAAARRAGRPTRGAQAATSSRVAGTGLRSLTLLVLIGLLVGTASAQLRRRQAAENGVRQSLVQEIGRRTAESDALAAQATRLRAEVNRARDAGLGADEVGRTTARRLLELEVATGEVAVRGPGVEVTIDDAAPPPNRDPALPSSQRGGAVEDFRVLDRDLQALANGLWAAGAEALSINGLRVTTRTAIRSAGQAVLVDFRPLSPPYVLRAVGDPAALEPAFVDGPTGRRYATYESLHGLRFAVRQQAELELPAAAASDLRLAVPRPRPPEPRPATAGGPGPGAG